MKNSKRILGVALALIMIFNVFAVGTFAAFPDDTAVKLMLSTDKATYAQGEIVTITFSEQVIEEVGEMYASGQYEIAYNSAVLKPLNTNVKVTEYGGFADLAGDAAVDNCRILFANACVGNGSSITDADASNYGWDEQIGVLYMIKDAKKFDATTAPLDLFTLQLKVADDAADGTYTIGFNAGGYEGYSAYSADVANEGLYGTSAADMGFSVDNMYEYGTVEITVGAAAPAEKEVKHADTMAQWADKAAGKINVGLVGKFLTEDIAIDYEGNKLTNVAKVGAKVTINGKEIEDYTEFVYDVNDDGSELWFRAVVTGVDYNATGAAGDISVVYVVEMTDGTTYESDAYTTTVAEVYAEACGNGMPAFGA